MGEEQLLWSSTDDFNKRFARLVKKLVDTRKRVVGSGEEAASKDFLRR